MGPRWAEGFGEAERARPRKGADAERRGAAERRLVGARAGRREAAAWTPAPGRGFNSSCCKKAANFVAGSMSATMTATATATAVAPAPEEAVERIASVPMSRGLKIEDLAAAPGGAGDQAEASQLFSVDALVHAVSGSVGGNVAMLGALRCPPGCARAAPALAPVLSPAPARARRRCSRLTAVRTQRSTRWTSS